MSSAKKLLTKIESKKAQVGIIGLGYVGGSLAHAVSSNGFKTIGFDIDKDKVRKLNENTQLFYKATDDFSKLSYCDIICICVPTPIYPNKKPNLQYLKSACQTLSCYLRKGTLIVLESSVTVGTTRNFVLPILRISKLKESADFFLAFSPERIDPGNQKYSMHNIPKVVSGLDEQAKQLTFSFYSQFVEKVYSVSSVEIAELTKILENVFRLVNISLINEIAEYANSAGVNIIETISAAATKPFGFLPHYPSVGAGGYCIPVLPQFLLHDAIKRKIKLQVVAASLRVNSSQPKRIVNHALKLLNGKRKNNKPKILLIGVTYKADTDEIRESQSLRIWQLAEKQGLDISYHDPYIPSINSHKSINLTDAEINTHDLIIIATPHSQIPYDVLFKSNKPLIDATHKYMNMGNTNAVHS